MLRIRKTRWKVAFYLVGVMVLNAVDVLVLYRVLPGVAAAIASNALFVAFIVGATRVFRGAGEAIAPPRAWWRATARPTAGYVVGGIFVVAVVLGILVPESRVDTDPVVGIVADAALAVYFLSSAVRLQRHPPAFVSAPDAPPRFKPIKG